MLFNVSASSPRMFLHELRTPLSLMKTQLSLARSRPRENKILLKMMAEIENDVDRMTRLVEQMLALARVEQQKLEVFQPVDLRIILNDLFHQYQKKAAHEGIKLDLILPPQVDLTLIGHEEHLRRVLINLIENAIRYTPFGGQIRLESIRKWNRIEIIVFDSGEPIPSEHLPHIFERFYRVEESRSRDSGGVGLGLAISQEIIKLHGGIISVQSQPENTTFIVNLPARKHESPN